MQWITQAVIIGSHFLAYFRQPLGWVHRSPIPTRVQHFSLPLHQTITMENHSHTPQPKTEPMAIRITANKVNKMAVNNNTLLVIFRSKYGLLLFEIRCQF